MTTQLTAITSPPQAPRALDHVHGFGVAVAATCVGAILTPFVALAWVAAQPILVIAVALRAASLDRADAASTAADQRAAA